MSHLSSPPGPKIDPKTISIHRPTAGALSPAGPTAAGPVAPRVGALDAPDDPTPPSTTAIAQVPGMAQPGNSGQLVNSVGRLVIDQYRNAYLVTSGIGNPVLYRIGTSEFMALLRRLIRERGENLTKWQLKEFVDELYAQAEHTGEKVTVARRVAQRANGDIVVALHDDRNTHVLIGPGKVEILASGSETLFYRSSSALAMVMPAAAGSGRLLAKYLNLHAVAFTLYLGWITYTLAHAKVDSTNFPILVLVGGQGTGKSHLSKVTIRLVDPNVKGVERMPSNLRDLAVAAQDGHLLAYDNLRHLTPQQSDTLCIMATGGSVTARKLYTDDDLKVMTLHSAVMLNSIGGVIDQPDLAQRCLPLRMEPMTESARKSEVELLQDFERDVPAIQRGIFDLIAEIVAASPLAVVSSPQRMIDFSRWLAALEIVDGAPSGTYQNAYAEALNEGQLDSLLDNVVGSAILDLVDTLDDDDPEWEGTPAELLSKLSLTKFADHRRPPREWPDNEIALSKRLLPLQAALMTQNIRVTFKRGKERRIVIRKIGGAK